MATPLGTFWRVNPISWVCEKYVVFIYSFSPCFCFNWCIFIYLYLCWCHLYLLWCPYMIILLKLLNP